MIVLLAGDAGRFVPRPIMRGWAGAMISAIERDQLVRPAARSATARLELTVDLPTPPFTRSEWLEYG